MTVNALRLYGVVLSRDSIICLGVLPPNDSLSGNGIVAEEDALPYFVILTE